MPAPESQTVVVAGRYDRGPDDLFAETRDFGALKRVMTGLATYPGLADVIVSEGDVLTFDVHFANGTVVTGHRVEVALVDETARRILFDERNEVVAVWRHLIEIEAEPSGGARWTDRIEIDAGDRTAEVAAQATEMYRYRHGARGGEVIDPDLEAGR